MLTDEVEICLEIWEQEPIAFINDVICYYNNPKAPPIPLGSRGHRVGFPSSSTPPIPLDTTSAPRPKRRRFGSPPRASQTAAEPSSTATVRPDPRPKTSMSRPSERTALEPSTRNPNLWRQTVLKPSPRALSDTCQQNRYPTPAETPTVPPVNSSQQPNLENSTSRKVADGKTCLQVDDLGAERRNISMRLHRSGVDAGVIGKMPSEHVRHLYTVLEPGKLGVGITHGELPRNYLRFWRCWEKSEVFGVEQALGMKSSSCFSAWLEGDGDVDIRLKVGRDEGVRWIVGRHPPMTSGKRRHHVKPHPSQSF